MEKIAIIGAGWLGLPLGAALVAKGHQVVGTTTRTEKLPRLAEEGLEGRIWNFAKSPIEDLDFLADVDVLIVTLPPGKSRGNYALKLKQLVVAAKDAGLQKLLYTSSTSVYPAHNQEVTENDVANVVSRHSGVAMLEMEEVIHSAQGLKPTIIRLGGLFGPHRQPGRWMAGRKAVPGPDNPVNMIHLDDCIGILSAVVAQQAWGKTYNAVAPEHPSRRDFYAKACAQLELEPPVWADRPASWKKVSAAKVMRELGYTFIYPNPISGI